MKILSVAATLLIISGCKPNGETDAGLKANDVEAITNSLSVTEAISIAEADVRKSLKNDNPADTSVVEAIDFRTGENYVAEVAIRTGDKCNTVIAVNMHSDLPAGSNPERVIKSRDPLTCDALSKYPVALKDAIKIAQDTALSLNFSGNAATAKKFQIVNAQGNPQENTFSFIFRKKERENPPSKCTINLVISNKAPVDTNSDCTPEDVGGSYTKYSGGFTIKNMLDKAESVALEQYKGSPDDYSSVRIFNDSTPGGYMVFVHRHIPGNEKEIQEIGIAITGADLDSAVFKNTANYPNVVDPAVYSLKEALADATRTATAHDFANKNFNDIRLKTDPADADKPGSEQPVIYTFIVKYTKDGRNCIGTVTVDERNKLGNKAGAKDSMTNACTP